VVWRSRYGALRSGLVGSGRSRFGGRVSVRFGSVGQACWVLAGRSWSGLEPLVGQGLVSLGGLGWVRSVVISCGTAWWVKAVLVR
jgi:hypothetical protein